MNDWKRWFIKDTAPIPLLAIIFGLLFGAIIMLLGDLIQSKPIPICSEMFSALL